MIRQDPMIDEVVAPDPDDIRMAITDALVVAEANTGRVWSFEYLGQPMPKQSVKGGKFGYYAPPKVVKRSKSIKQLAQYLANEQGQPGTVCIDGPLTIDVIFYFPWTGTDSDKQRKFLTVNGLDFRAKRPDLDNLLKLLLDALEGVFYADDRLIVLQRVMKKSSTKPRVQIVMREIVIPDK